MKRAGIVTVAILTVTSSGCGGKSTSTPTTPSRTPVSLALSQPNHIMRLKEVRDLAVTAAYSDGTTAAVTATWRAEPASIVTFNGNTATAAALGSATVTAQYQGLTAAGTVVVIGNFHGTWTGEYRFAACVDSQDFSLGDFCKELLSDPDGYGLELRLTQTGANITGTINFVDINGNVTGTVEGSRLGLSGSFSFDAEGIQVNFALQNWDTTSTDAEQMTGSFQLTFTSPAFRGNAILTCQLTRMTKTSAQPLAATATGNTLNSTGRSLGRRAAAAVRDLRR